MRGKHRRRVFGPKKHRPLVHCLWLSDHLGSFHRSTIVRRGVFRDVYDHVVLSDVLVMKRGRS